MTTEIIKAIENDINRLNHEVADFNSLKNDADGVLLELREIYQKAKAAASSLDPVICRTALEHQSKYDELRADLDNKRQEMLIRSSDIRDLRRNIDMTVRENIQQITMVAVDTIEDLLSEVLDGKSEEEVEKIVRNTLSQDVFEDVFEEKVKRILNDKSNASDQQGESSN